MTLAALIAPRLHAQTTATFEGAAFLLLPVGARATALGQAAAADGGTTESLFWNPAGLAELRKTEAALHHYAIFAGTGDALVVAIPVRNAGTFTAGAYILAYADSPTQNGPGPATGNALARNIALELGYATTVAGGVSAGIVYKLVQFRVDCTAGDCGSIPIGVGTTHAIDIGVRVALGGTPMIFGASIRNLGLRLQVNNREQADPLPTRAQAGVAFVILHPGAGMEGFDVRMLVDVQGAVRQGRVSPATLCGVEAGVRDVLRVRAGFAFVDSQQRGPSLGVGIKVGRLGFDVARTFYPSGAIDEQDPFTVSLRLGF